MKQIGRYQIREELGLGRIAQVYRAYDPHFEREVALKLIEANFLGNQQFYVYFEQQAALIAAFEHPAVVPLYDFGVVDDQPYLVMRLMLGGSLAERLKAKPKGFLVPDVSELLNRLSDALDMAHQKGIVHRHLKPANVLFDEQGDAYLSDFGLSKLLEYTNIGLRRTDVPLGTLAYISPEEARGDRLLIDGRSDLYSLAVMLFELLTGELPFKANLPAGFIYQHIGSPIPNICEIRGDLPQSGQSFIQRAMAKKPTERYSTADEMASAFKKVLAESLSTAHRLQRFLQSKPLSQLLWFLFLLGAVALISPQMPPIPSFRELLSNKQPSFALATTVTPSVTVEAIITPTLIRTQLPTNTNPPANPEEAAISLADGEEYYRKREYDEAIEAFSEAIGLAPNEPASYYLRAMAYFSKGQYELAVDDYSQALILNSTLEEAYYYRGKAYEELALFPLAIADYQAAIHLNPTNNQYYLAFAEASYFSFSYDEAIVSYDEALHLNPNDARAYVGLARAYQGKEEYQKAESNYSQALALDGQFIDAYYYRALLYAQQENYQKAIADYSQAIRLSPQDDMIYFHRAQSYELIGNLEAAIVDYKQVLLLNRNRELMASAQAALEKLGIE